MNTLLSFPTRPRALLAGSVLMLSLAAEPYARADNGDDADVVAPVTAVAATAATGSSNDCTSSFSSRLAVGRNVMTMPLIDDEFVGA